MTCIQPHHPLRMGVGRDHGMRWLSLPLALALTVQISVAQIPPPTDAPKPLTPEQSAAAFKLPEGFRMEVIASEPLIASPSGVCWDERGRMFVSELHGYNLEGQLDVEELNKTGQLDTVVRRVQADEKFKKAAERGTYGVVKLLRDTDGDGRMDRADVWSTNLPAAYGLVPARGGVIVACAPHIIFLADRDGDGKAEVQEKLFSGFKIGPLERGINAPQRGADGWIYFGRGAGGGRITGPNLAQPVDLPASDFRIRADGSAIEPVTGGTGTFGFALTEAGDRFTKSTGEPGHYVAPLPWRYLTRNPDATTPRLEAATGDKRVYPLAPAHPWRQKRADHAAYAKFYRDRYGAGDSDAGGWFTSACGPLIYEDSALPGLRGQYFVCEPSGNLIHRALIKPDGSVLTLHRAPGEEKSEFAATSDSWSHPMNLLHGPDGSIWIVDYSREIIEDYSAIPRHLQQQYGVYAGHDRGRIYRLTHRNSLRPPVADMSKLDTKSLAREVASSLFWRRQTAQRLLVEKGDQSAAPILRELLIGQNSAPATLIIVLRTLDGLNALAPTDVQPFICHSAESVRVHALQLADRWFAKDEGRAVLDATLAAAATETSSRVQIQFALSLGESRDPRAFAMLARYAREKLDVRWMDVAVLSSLHRRGGEMLAELIHEPGGSAAFLPPLAQSIAARRNETELARAINLAATVKPDTQTVVLTALAKGRKNAPRKPLGDVAARKTLATLAASPDAEVRKATHALEDTFLVTVADDEGLVPAGQLPPIETISDETFRKFVAALAGPRDVKRGHELFVLACAICHRIGQEGHEVGPDLLGQIGLGEEALLKDILMPNERTRPGYETTLVQLADGTGVTGILKDDGATSLTLALPNGVEQVLLRKDVTGVRRLATSLMPSFAEGLAPADVANLLAWLRSNLDPSTPAAFEQVRTELRRAINDGKAAGAAHLVMRDGKTLYLAEAGYSDIEAKSPLKADSIVRMYSMTKPLTSVAAMILHEQGNYGLDDPVFRYIPAFTNATVIEKVGDEIRRVAPKRPLTIRDVLRHTTGYSYGDEAAVREFYVREGMRYWGPGDMFPPKMTIAKAAEALARIPALHHPGEKFTYGYSTDLLGRLIEVWSGKPLDVFLRESVLEPLEMADTGFSVPPQKRARFTPCLTVRDGKFAVLDPAASSPFNDGFEFLSGGGGLLSTVNDYAKFCQMLVGGGLLKGRRLLKPETLKLMFSDQLTDVGGSFKFGLGFAIEEIKLGPGEAQRHAMQYSWGGYASTEFRIVPAERLIQIFARQQIPYTQDLAKKQFAIVYEGLNSSATATKNPAP